MLARRSIELAQQVRIFPDAVRSQFEMWSAIATEGMPEISMTIVKV